jgi:hypothetical protein
MGVNSPLYGREKMNKALISLYDYTGNASRPYRENGWRVIQIDKQLGIDVMEWNYIKWYQDQEYYGTYPGFAIIAMIPCTDYAISGAKHFAAKDADGRTAESQRLVEKTREIINFFDNMRVLLFWQIEQPMSRIHKLNTWMGKPKLKFNPCDFAQYDPVPENSQYNKMTWLWGNFNIPEKKPLPPLSKEFPGFKKLGGKSLKTKNARSITPLGFAYAFYYSNN